MLIYCGSSSPKHITSDLPSSLLKPQNKMISSAESILTSRDLSRNWKAMNLSPLSPLTIDMGTGHTLTSAQPMWMGFMVTPASTASWLCLMSCPCPSSYMRVSSPATKNHVKGKNRIICSWCVIHVSFLSQECICYSHAVSFMVPYPLLWRRCENLRAKESSTFLLLAG